MTWDLWRPPNGVLIDQEIYPISTDFSTIFVRTVQKCDKSGGAIVEILQKTFFFHFYLV